MTDVIFYNFPDKKRGKEYTNHRENKVPEVYIIATETFDQEMLNEMYGGFQKISSKGSKHTNHEAQHQNKMPGLNVHIAPGKHLIIPNFVVNHEKRHLFFLVAKIYKLINRRNPKSL
jgi:hypothetical protein